MRTPDLFPETQPPAAPRPPRRVLMHVCDAGQMPGVDMAAQFECRACGATTRWMPITSVSEAKRGLPCPRCNPTSTLTEEDLEDEQAND